MAATVQATRSYYPRHLSPTNPVRTLAFVMLRALQVCASVAVLAIVAAFAIGGLLLHMGISPVLTGSMRPTFAPGDAVITRPVSVHSLHAGDIAVFVPPGESAPYAHRITSVRDIGGHVVLTTKGDANVAPDRWRARLNDDRVPVVVTSIPYFGHVMAMTSKPWMRAAGIGLLGLLLTAIGTSAIVRSGPSSRRSRRTPRTPYPAFAS